MRQNRVLRTCPGINEWVWLPRGCVDQSLCLCLCSIRSSLRRHTRSERLTADLGDCRQGVRLKWLSTLRSVSCDRPACPASLIAQVSSLTNRRWTSQLPVYMYIYMSSAAYPRASLYDTSTPASQRRRVQRPVQRLTMRIPARSPLAL